MQDDVRQVSMSGDVIQIQPVSSLAAVGRANLSVQCFRIVHENPTKQVLILPKFKKALAASHLAVAWHEIVSFNPDAGEMVIIWRSSMSSGSGDGAQLLAVPAANGFDALRPMLLEWSVNCISFNAQHLPNNLRSVASAQMALDKIFQAGAFPGDASPVFTLVHSGHQNTLDALQALESGGFVSCCQLLEAMSTWRATQDTAEKRKQTEV